MAAINAGARRRLGGLSAKYGLGLNTPEPSAVFDFTRGSLDDAIVRGSDKRFTFTRADTALAATYFDGSGTLRRAPHNLVGRSHDIENWTSINANHTVANGVAANPVDGATTAFRITRSGSGGNAGTDTQYTITDKIYTGDKIAVSMYFKNETMTVQMRMQVRGTMIADQLGFIGVSFDETTLEPTGNNANDNDRMSYTAVGDGWYYLEGVFTAVADDTDGWTIGITAGGAADQGNSYLGYGVQVEINDVARPLIVTTGGTANYSGPRFGHVYDGTNWNAKGLLIEGARTNSLTYNRDFSNAAWTDTNTPTVSSATGIDGLSKNLTLTDNLAGGREAKTATDITVSDDTSTHTVSAFLAKTTAATTYPGVQATFINGATSVGAEVVVNTNTGVGSQSTDGDADATNITVEDWGDWWRVWFNLTNNASGHTVLRITARPAQTDDANWPDRSASATGSATYDFMQVELNVSFPSSPIETGASAVTRNADVCALTGLDTAGWFNAAEGTFYIEARHNGFPTNPHAVVFDDGTTNETLTHYVTTAGAIGYTIRNNVSNQVAITTGSIATLTDYSFAGAYKINDCAMAFDGGSLQTDQSATMPSPTQMVVGDRGGGDRTMFGHISKIIYWPVRLPNDVLQQITA